jgi:hypothetical protein
MEIVVPNIEDMGVCEESKRVLRHAMSLFHSFISPSKSHESKTLCKA